MSAAATSHGLDEQPYRLLVERLPAPVYMCDTSGRIIMYNKAAAALWGREPQPGKDLWCGSWRLYRPDGSPLPPEACPMAIAVRDDTTITDQECVIERPDGTRRHVLQHPEPVRDRAGAVVGAINMLVDITDRRPGDEAQSLLASIVNSSDDAIISKTLDGTITSWNEGAERIFGYTAAEAVGRPISMLIPAERRDEETEILSRLRRGERIDHFETVRQTRDGRLLTISLSVSPVRDRHGRIVGAAKIARDITPQKLAERALHESEERYRTLAESMPFIVWQTDAAGATGYTNRFLQDYSGWTPEELRTSDGWPLVHPDDRNAMQDRFAYSIRTGEPFRGALRMRRNDGAWRWFEVAAEAVRDKDGRIARWVGAAIDIDDRRKAESCLAAVRDDLALQVAGLTRLHELSTALTATRDLPAAFRAILAAVCDLHATDHGLLALYDPSTGELVEGAGLRFDGSALRRLTGLRPGPGAGACGNCFDTRQRIIIEDTENDACFAEYRTVARELGFRAVHSTPIFSRSGEALGVLSVQFGAPRRPTEREIQFADMCARLAADAIASSRSEAELNSHREHLEHLVIERTRELEESHQRLRHAERMALLGTLSAGLGHDMGNLLMPVRVRIESLERAGLAPDLAEDVRAIKTSAEYLQRLSSGLRLLALDPERSRRGDTTELGSWWSDSQPVFRNGLARGLSLVGHVPDQPCWAEIAKASLTQAIFNLIQNAGDALKGRTSGVVTVSVRPDEHKVRISVADDGPGMTEEVRQRCMEPFFTTKSRAISTGLGLVLVGGLVRDAGGTIDIASEPGKGTTVTIEVSRVYPDRGSTAASDGDRRDRSALVILRDARMRLFVMSELGSLAFEVLSDSPSSSARPPHIVVLDRAGARADGYARQGARVIILADAQSSVPGVTALGARPSVGSIRQALRVAAERDPVETHGR